MKILFEIVAVVLIGTWLLSLRKSAVELRLLRRAPLDSFLICPNCFQTGGSRSLRIDPAEGLTEDEKYLIRFGRIIVDPATLQSGSLVVRARCDACGTRYLV